MTYQQLRDLIITKIKLYTTTNNLPYSRLSETFYYQLITEAESEIQTSLQVLISTKNATVTSADTLGLPDNFGKLVSFKIGGEEPKYLPPKEFQLTTTGDVTYTLYDISEEQTWQNDGTTWNADTSTWDSNWQNQSFKRILLNTTISNTTVEISYYQAIIDSLNDQWTSGSTVQLPKEYYNLIQFRVLADIIPSYWNIYFAQLKQKKGYRNVTPMEEIPGALGY